MSTVVLEYPEAWLAALSTDAPKFERGRFTSGQAAQFAGVSRTEFQLSCPQWGVDSVNWDQAELEVEFTTPLPERA